MIDSEQLDKTSCRLYPFTAAQVTVADSADIDEHGKYSKHVDINVCQSYILLYGHTVP